MRRVVWRRASVWRFGPTAVRSVGVSFLTASHCFPLLPTHSLRVCVPLPLSIREADADAVAAAVNWLNERDAVIWPIRCCGLRLLGRLGSRARHACRVSPPLGQRPPGHRVRPLQRCHAVRVPVGAAVPAASETLRQSRSVARQSWRRQARSGRLPYRWRWVRRRRPSARRIRRSRHRSVRRLPRRAVFGRSTTLRSLPRPLHRPD